MAGDRGRWDPRRVRWVSLSNVPVVVAGVALVSWLFASNGIHYDPDVGIGVMLNPFNYPLSMVLHSDWGHFAGNMRLWIPVGIVFTLLTSNRHVFLVAVLSHLLTQIVSNGMFRFGVGLSVAVFALLTATLVRSVGIAFQNYSKGALQWALVVTIPPILGAVFLVVLVVGPSPIGHLEHFFGALFGAGLEAIYVISGHGSGSSTTTEDRPSAA